jgi:hypothetical protein
LKGGKGSVDASAGTRNREAVDEDGDVGEVGEDAPLPEGLKPGAGASDEDIEVRVRI